MPAPITVVPAHTMLPTPALVAYAGCSPPGPELEQAVAQAMRTLR
jgi:hypothetical protein